MEEIQEEMCRLCLQTSLDMENIFTSQNNYCQIVEDLIGIKVMNKIGFPSNICRECLAILQDLFNFKEKCIKNDKRIQEYFIKKENSLCELIIKTEIKTEFEESTIICSENNKTNNIIDDTIPQCTNNLDNDEILCKNEKSSPIIVSESDNDDSDDESVESSKNTIEFCSVDNIEEIKVNDDKNIKKDNNIKNKTEISMNKVKKKRQKFTCHLCGKFYTKSELIGHMNMHNGLKPYQCPAKDCDQSFTSKLLQQRHYKFCHTDYALYVCDICGKKCKLKSKLIIHRTIHFDPKLPCKICGKLFKNNKSISQHMRVHTGEKSFKCDVCNKFFSTKSSLKIHHQNHVKTCM